MAKRIPDIPVGTRSGQLEVVELLPDHRNPSGRRYQRVRAKCDCGGTLDVMAVRIRLGKATRCPSCVRAPQRKYNIGDRYGKLVVRSFYYDTTGRRMARCQCDCGNETSVFVGLFGRNGDRNCGCTPLSTFTGVGRLSGAFFHKIVDNAKRRGLAVEVTKAELWALFLEQDQRCALSDLPLALSVRGITTASVDRIDSDKGYTLDNVQWVHKDVNRMKGDLPPDRFLDLCRLVSERHGGTPFPTMPTMPKPPKPRPRRRPGKTATTSTK